LKFSFIQWSFSCIFILLGFQMSESLVEYTFSFCFRPFDRHFWRWLRWCFFPNSFHKTNVDMVTFLVFSAILSISHKSEYPCIFILLGFQMSESLVEYTSHCWKYYRKKNFLGNIFKMSKVRGKNNVVRLAIRSKTIVKGKRENDHWMNENFNWEIFL
jgi:hypothetical protein